MRETKDQKIERLEKVISNQKKELSKVKKDRKRLNYAVERLEREKKKALNTLTPAAITLISEYSDQVTEIEKKNEELKTIITEREKVIADKEERYNILLSKCNEKKADESEIRKQIWGDKQKFEKEVMERTIKKIVDSQNDIRLERYKYNREQRKYLRRFIDGKPFYSHLYDDDPDYSDDDLSENYIFPCHFMFSPLTLLINVHPQSGRRLEEFDHIALQYILQQNSEYKEAITELTNFNGTNPSGTELMNWTYQKGMELLPLYRDKIF